MWDLLGTCSFATWSCPIESLYLLLVFTAIGQWTCRKRTFSVWIQIGLMFDCLFTRLLFSQFLWGAPSSLGHLNSTLLHSSARVCNLNPARLRVYSLPVSQQLVGVPNIYWGVRCYFLRDWGVLGVVGVQTDTMVPKWRKLYLRPQPNVYPNGLLPDSLLSHLSVSWGFLFKWVV